MLAIAGSSDNSSLKKSEKEEGEIEYGRDSRSHGGGLGFLGGTGVGLLLGRMEGKRLK